MKRPLFLNDFPGFIGLSLRANTGSITPGQRNTTSAGRFAYAGSNRDHRSGGPVRVDP